MKNKILSIIAAAYCLVACDLTHTPLAALSPETFFSNESELQAFSNTFYTSLTVGGFDEISDMLTKNVLTDEIMGSRTVPNSGGGWSYTALRNFNTLIEYSVNCPDEKIRTQYVALARFFRANFYFDKVKRFGDVPWYDKQLGSDDPGLYKPRDSREFVMSKVIEDLDFAIANLPDKKDLYRITKWTALALKSRACLFEGTFRKYHAGQSTLKTLPGDAKDYTFYLQEAADAAKQIMDSGKYSLYSTGKPAADYRDMFVQENCESNKEYILSIKFDYGLGIFHNGTAYGLLPSQGRVGATRKFIDSFLMKDGSRYTDKAGWESKQFAEQIADRDPRLAQSFRTPGYTRIDGTDQLAPDFSACCTGYHTTKWVMSCKANGGDSDRVDRSTSDLPVYRLGEILLIYAEAKAELGTITQADLDASVNLLRKRVGMPGMRMDVTVDPYLTSPETGYTNPKLLASSNLAVILEVRRERAVELAQEGTNYRWYDIVRWREGKCIEQPYYGIYFPGAGEYDLNGDGKLDYCLYEGDVKPNSSATSVLKIGSDIILSNGASGYVQPHKAETRSFNEGRDYYYPIPINERSLNPNLTQNDGWDDGLDF